MRVRFDVRRSRRKVTILEALPNLLPGCDEDVVKQLSRSFNKRGIAVHTGVQVKGHSPRGAGTTVSYGDGQSLDVEMVVVSVGRRPYTDQLLERGHGGSVDDRGFVVIDEFQRTGEPGVWAVGDVVNTPSARSRGIRRGHRRGEEHALRARRPRRLHPRTVVHLLPSRGGFRRPVRVGCTRGAVTTSWSRRTRSAGTAEQGSSAKQRDS